MVQHFTYATREGNELPISLYSRDDFGQRPCILYLHGFKGFKDWGFVPHAAHYFVAQGFSFVAFNFSHNGIGEDGETFSEVARFERNTFSLELGEAQEMVRMLAHTNFLGADLRKPLGLLGHSRGGGQAILTAHTSSEVKAVATWAAVSTFDRYGKEAKEAWRKRGFYEVTNSRTGQVFHLSTKLLDDLEAHGRSSLNILEAARNLQKPLLLVHGQGDETVPYFEAEQLNIFAEPRLTTLSLIPKVGHTFDTRHPFDQSNEAFDRVLAQTADFFREHLGA
jgi:dipeptidyl aminopeptidase/acylaminoacyl peptidase